MKKIWKYIAVTWGQASGSWSGVNSMKDAKLFVKDSEDNFIYRTIKSVEEDVEFYQKLAEGRSDYRPILKVLKEIVQYHS